MKIVEKRILSKEDLRMLCCGHLWYTRGDADDYTELMNMTINRSGSLKNITTDILFEMAQNIIEHGAPEKIEGYDVCDVMFELADKCITTFKVKDA